MNARSKDFNVSQDELEFVRNFRLSIAAAAVAVILVIAGMAPGERTVEIVASAHAGQDSGATVYFPDLFNPSGEIEPQPATF